MAVLRREKRNHRIPPTYVEPELGQQLELFAQEDGAVSMSDWLRRQLGEIVTVRIARQRIVRRVGNQ